MATLLDVARALADYEGLEGAEVRRLGSGLINDTYLVRFGARRLVLQRVNTVFDASIHDNIAAVTEHLAARGMVTPRLMKTRQGTLYTEVERRIWRLMTYVEGVSVERLATPAQAAAVGGLVGRFHAALDDLEHVFSETRLGVHDTAKHIARLEEAVAEHRDHRLHAQVASLADQLIAQALQLPLLGKQPLRNCHGDLKLDNVLFDEAEPGKALCLIDLDTVGPMALAHELGDAWRSWCNPAGEDDGGAVAFDLAIFEASWGGYLRELGRPLPRVAREALLHGPEWISLELGARFAADALAESYFSWDRGRFPAAGEHNLVRARAQWGLCRATIACRDERAAILGLG
jgi:Ser/Thr protein kinase RdoA (MazF antagonist)